MKLNRKEYIDKVRACFIGKNIGGTIGGPTEGKREILDVKGFSTPKGQPLPNDDLDLQLIWLRALEMQGPQNINSEVLGRYWLNFIPPSWAEYGICKHHMLQGIEPGVSGSSDINIWSHSNGAWIRSEIWATTNPLLVDHAVRYALHDAMVDHGMGEGTIAAAFVAAMESAAFGITDIHELIRIGLSKIDPETRTAKTVKEVLRLHEEGKTWQEVRNAIVELNADIGDGWFQAPSNIAFVLIGLLYGEGDYKKSLLIAVNCGDDTDCTGATIGALMGIMHGTKVLPEDWVAYIGNRIVTCSINVGTSPRIPSTIDDLVRRVGRMAEICCYFNGNGVYTDHLTGLAVEFTDGPTELERNLSSLLDRPWAENNEQDDIRALRLSLKPNAFAVHRGSITAIVRYIDGLNLNAGETKHIGLTLVNNVKAYGNEPLTANVLLHVPEGCFTKESGFSFSVPCWTAMTPMAHSQEYILSFEVDEVVGSKQKAVLEIEVPEQGKTHYIDIVFSKYLA